MPKKGSLPDGVAYTVIASGITLTLLLLKRFSVGYWADDARDILAASSILQGSYSYMQLPGHPPASFPLPGFPLLLSPWVFLFAPRWEYLKLASLIWSWSGIVLAFLTFRKHLSLSAALSFLILICLNLNTTTLSSQVLADAPYFFCLYGSFFLLNRIHHKNKFDVVLLSLMALASAWIRPEGFFLLAALGIAFASGRQWQYFYAIFMAGACAASVFLWNFLRTGIFIGYQSLWKDSFSVYQIQPLIWLENFGKLLEVISVEIVGSVDFSPRTAGGKWLIISACALIMGTFGYGLLTWLRRREIASVLRMTVGLYLLFHIGVHVLWLAIHPHYFWPLLPLIVFFMTYGWDRMSFKYKEIGLTGGMLIFLFFSASQHLSAIQAMRQGSSQRHPQITYDWIQKNTDPHEFFLASEGSALSLYTGRFAQTFLQASQEDEFYAKLLRGNFTHVMSQPTAYLHVQALQSHDPTWIWFSIGTWLRARPEAFQLLYENTDEQTAIFQIHRDARFEQAYARFQAAMQDLHRYSLAEVPWEAHMNELEKIIQIKPFTSILNAYGVASLISGQRIDKGLRYLKQANVMRPEEMTIRRNLEKLTHKAKHQID